MMLISVIACVAFGVFCVYCIVSGVRKQKEIRVEQKSPDYYMNEKEHDEAIKQIESFEKGYFERVKNGEQTQQFLSVGSMMMCSFLRSLFSLFVSRILSFELILPSPFASKAFFSYCCCC